MEASSAKGVHVQLYLNIWPRDFSITIYPIFGLAEIFWSDDGRVRVSENL